MKIWVDAQLSPEIAAWLSREFGVQAVPVRDLGLREAEDQEIFEAARDADAVVLTKDRDFLMLLDRVGPPPRIIWLTCGNTSNKALKQIFADSFQEIIDLLASGETLVEIGSI